MMRDYCLMFTLAKIEGSEQHLFLIDRLDNWEKEKMEKTYMSVRNDCSVYQRDY